MIAQTTLVDLRALVETLVSVNVDYLKLHVDTLPLADQSIRYRRSTDDSWADIPTCIARGHADVMDVIAWRLAEYRVIRIDAQVVFLANQEYGLITAIIRLPDGNEEDATQFLKKDLS